MGRYITISEDYVYLIFAHAQANHSSQRLKSAIYTTIIQDNGDPVIAPARKLPRKADAKPRSGHSACSTGIS